MISLAFKFPAMKTKYLFISCAFFFFGVLQATAQVKILQTIAGSSTSGHSGDNGPATAAKFSANMGYLTYDAFGNLYIADSWSGAGWVRKINTNTGIVTTVAGGAATFGDNVQATATYLSGPTGVALDGAGNLYITETSGYRIRKVDIATGLITTIAGNGTYGFSGDGFAATAAQMVGPRGLVFDALGNLYFSDFGGGNAHIRKVTTSGIISSVAGISSIGSSGDGGPASAASLTTPSGLALDAAGDLYIADGSSQRIRKISFSSGIISSVAGTTVGFSGDGSSALTAQFSNPIDVKFDVAGNMYVADLNNMRIRKVDGSGIITTVAGSTSFGGFGGDGAPAAATTARFNGPYGIALTPSGNIYITDFLNSRIREVRPNTAPTFTGTSPITLNVCMNAAPTSFSSLLGIMDRDYPQTETWSLFSSAVNGTVVVSGIATSNGSSILPLGGSITYQPTTGYTGYDSFKVKVKDGYDSSITTVYVNVNSYAGAISGPSFACVGATATLSDFVSGGTWSSSNTAVATVSSTGLVTALSVGTANISYAVTTSPCAAASIAQAFTVMPTPPAGMITGPGDVCVGASMTLSNALTGGTWTIGGTSTATITPGGMVTGATAGTAIITYTILTTCGFTPTTTIVTINSLPNPGIITGPASVCVGSVILLADAIPGGVWSDGSANTSTSGGAVTGTSVGAGMVSYSVTNMCGTASAAHPVSVITIPSAGTITGPSSVCTGGSMLLSNSAPGGVWSVTGGATISSSGLVTGTSVGAASVTYLVGNACGTANTTKPIVVNTVPAMGFITGPTNVCQGYSMMLSGSPAGGTWSAGSGSATVSGGGAVNGVSAGLAPISYNLTNVCGITSAVSYITVNPAVTPSLGLSASPGTILCSATGPVTFTALPTNGGSLPFYNWYVNGVPAGGSGPAFTYTPANGDIIKSRLTSNAGCVLPDTAIATATIAILPSLTPGITIDASPNDTLCELTMVTFVATAVNGGTAPTYTWTKNGVNDGTGSTYNLFPTSGDIIRCLLTSDLGCLTSPVALSHPVVMQLSAPSENTVVITASTPKIILGSPVVFTATAPHAGASPVYQWYVDGIVVPAATLRMFSTSSLVPGNVVSCSVISSDVCAAPSMAMSNSIVAELNTGVRSVVNSDGFTLQPNPNNGVFTIKSSGMVTGNEAVSVVVTDMLGRTVYNNVAHLKNGSVEEQIVLGQGCANGLYVLQITGSDINSIIQFTLGR
jgi:hypothetical protein